MISKLQKFKTGKAKSGFTIIEVLIVLAIAGLILLIVFLAVPALQRNSRNTAIKNDVQNVVGGVAEYQSANNGAMPGKIEGTGTIEYMPTSGNANKTSINVQGSTLVKTAQAAPSEDSLQVGEITVVIGQKCPSEGSANVVSKRAVAAFFLIETSSKPVLQCTDS